MTKTLCTKCSGQTTAPSCFLDLNCGVYVCPHCNSYYIADLNSCPVCKKDLISKEDQIFVKNFS